MFDAIVRHGTLVTVSVMIVAVLGILAALRIPVQMIPDLDVRTITVNTNWPGATPQDGFHTVPIDPRLVRQEGNRTPGH